MEELIRILDDCGLSKEQRAAIERRIAEITALRADADELERLRLEAESQKQPEPEESPIFQPQKADEKKRLAVERVLGQKERLKIIERLEAAKREKFARKLAEKETKVELLDRAKKWFEQKKSELEKQKR